MRIRYLLIGAALLISLVIYTCYRTEQTVVNKLILALFQDQHFSSLRKLISSNLPLNEHLIYSLPEGLWIFAITLTSESLHITSGNRQLRLVYLPLVFCTALELMQLNGITNGRFDLWDIGLSFIFWAVALLIINNDSPQQNLFKPVNFKSRLCILSYGVAYLAEVWK